MDIRGLSQRSGLFPFWPKTLAPWVWLLSKQLFTFEVFKDQVRKIPQGFQKCSTLNKVN